MSKQANPPLSKFAVMFCAVFVLALLLPARPAPPVRAQSGDSSCLACHEVAGENPVSEKGAWHRQHSLADMCAACHAGDPKAASREQAHASVIANPLDEAASTCSTCHPEDYALRTKQYADLIGPTAAATLTPASHPAVTPAPTPIATHSPRVSDQPPASTRPAVDWLAILRFARGPFFRASLWFFVIGMLYRLMQIVRLGWKHRRGSNRRRPASGVAASFLKGLVAWPYIPWAKGAFRRGAVTYVAGGVFHLGLFAVAFFSRAHVLVWKGLIGFGWPALPPTVVAWLAACAIVALIALMIYRLVNPVLRLLSGPAEWLNWAMVFLPMITGFALARRWWLPYETMFAAHMIVVDALLIWIPLSRISHFLFYFFSRTIHGLEFGRRPEVL